MEKPLNIVYLHSHDTGRYVQPYGYPVHTPRLQRFAEQGVLFRQAFCANPTCSASRSGLLTGMWPHQNGMIGLTHRGARIHDYRWHLASFLHELGYKTALAGVQHEIESGHEAELGYEALPGDCALPGGQKGDEATVLRAKDFLAQSHTKPFFLSCGFDTTHRLNGGRQPEGENRVQWHNGEASPLGDPRYVRPPAPFPDTPDTRADWADFAVAATRLDNLMGDVIDALDKSPHADNTLVICTTDHGIAFPFMKCNLTDHGIGVMLMMRLRGRGRGRGRGFEAGNVIDAMVSQVDVYPTICELVGAKAPDRLVGRSIMPLLCGEAQTIRDEVFATVNYHAAYEPMRAVRNTRYKYIRRFDPQKHPVLPNCDDSPTKNYLLRNGWRDRGQAAEELYDLVYDPTESCNRATDVRYEDALNDLRGRLERWMRETSDPLISGYVPPRAGMIVNRVDGLSPAETPEAPK